MPRIDAGQRSVILDLLQQASWTGQGKPDIGVLVTFTASEAVREWVEGDTLKVLDYVGLLGTTDTVPVCWNVERESSEVVSLSCLRMTPADAEAFDRFCVIQDMMSEGPIDDADRLGFCETLHRRGYRRISPDPAPAPLE